MVVLRGRGGAGREDQRGAGTLQLRSRVWPGASRKARPVKVPAVIQSAPAGQQVTVVISDPGDMRLVAGDRLITAVAT